MTHKEVDSTPDTVLLGEHREKNIRGRNMIAHKLSRKIIGGALFCCVAGALAVQSYYFMSSSFVRLIDWLGPGTVECTFVGDNPILVQTGCTQRINEYCRKTTMVSFTFEGLYRFLKREFPIVKRCCYTASGFRYHHFLLEFEVPWCTINQRYVLGKSKRRLFDYSHFDGACLINLPNIFVNPLLCSQEKFSEQCARWCRSLTPHECDNYEIEYRNPTDIYFLSKQPGCRYAIVLTDDCLDRSLVFDRVDSVYQDLESKGLITKKMKASQELQLLFDVRFKNRVYVKRCNKVLHGGRSS